MARVVLAIALMASAFGILEHKVWEFRGGEPIMFFDLLLMLPAVLLGSIYWWKGRSYASRWPVVLCIALAWISLFYPGNVEKSRGLLIATLVSLPLPLAALIVEKRAWEFCAKIYVWANGAAMLAAIWFESRVEHSVLSLMGRFGFLVAGNGSDYTANPNQVGGQFAFAAIVAFILYLKGCEDEKSKSGFPDVYLILMAMLSAGCMMTASRGAFAAWLPAMGLLYFFGTRRLPRERLRDLVAVSAVGLLIVFSLLVAGRAAPWEKLTERFGDQRTMSNVSNRSDIWRGALRAWQADPDFFLRGTGIGMADNVAGEHSPLPEEDERGVLRKNCHNGAIEWILSLGLAGIVAGICLAGSIAYQMVRLDTRDRNVGRIAMIACVVIFAMTAVSYRHKCWPATGALVLAMLTEPAIRRREEHSDCESLSLPDCHLHTSHRIPSSDSAVHDRSGVASHVAPRQCPHDQG